MKSYSARLTIQMKAIIALIMFNLLYIKVLSFNYLTPRVKPWVIQSFLTLDSMYRTLTTDIHWKAIEQYFTVVLFVNPLTPRVKHWVIQSFLTFDSMDTTLKCDHSLESC